MRTDTEKPRSSSVPEPHAVGVIRTVRPDSKYVKTRGVVEPFAVIAPSR